jgi:ComF family protein
VYAPFWYQAPIDQLISELKYQQRWQNLSCFMSLFTQHCPPIPRNAQILAMPSHPHRVRERGFNLVNQCVRAWHRYHTFNYSLSTLVRTRYTRTQTSQQRDQRQLNVKNVFAVHKPLESDLIILFDDVMTTGASANQCVKVIKQAGAKHVEVWCLARACIAFNHKLK